MSMSTRFNITECYIPVKWLYLSVITRKGYARSGSRGQVRCCQFPHLRLRVRVNCTVRTTAYTGMVCNHPLWAVACFQVKSSIPSSVHPVGCLLVQRVSYPHRPRTRLRPVFTGYLLFWPSALVCRVYALRVCVFPLSCIGTIFVF